MCAGELQGADRQEGRGPVAGLVCVLELGCERHDHQPPRLKRSPAESTKRLEHEIDLLEAALGHREDITGEAFTVQAYQR